MPVNFVNIPDVLKQTASFCVWKLEKRYGRPTKVPYNPRTGAMARTNDPSTFADFNTAMKSYAIGGWDGIGYRVSEGIGAIDIDHCIREDGSLNDVAASILGIFPDAYFERSPSGTSLRGFFRLSPDFAYDKTVYYINNRKHGLIIVYSEHQSKEDFSMIRKIIHIDEEKCNGCGACVTACHEGAIGLVNGKAKLMRDDYCDGFGDCLPACPTGAITFEEREAAAYDEQAVLENKQKKAAQAAKPAFHGCPGSAMRQFRREESAPAAPTAAQPSQLRQWPCQIKLVPVNAPYFDGAKLLIAADCTAYAYANVHEEFMKGKITLIGCPKLDAVDYSEKLTEIFRSNDIRSVTVLRMEVPCCGGLEHAAVTALKNSGKFVPWQVVTISTDGRILDR